MKNYDSPKKTEAKSKKKKSLWGGPVLPVGLPKKKEKREMMSIGTLEITREFKPQNIFFHFFAAKNSVFLASFDP